MSLSNYLEYELLDHIFSLDGGFSQPAHLYVALFTGDPGEDGTSNEVTGTDYAREQNDSDWTRSTNEVSNSAAVTFTEAGSGGWGTVSYFGIFDAASGGNFLGGGSLTASKSVEEGDVVEFAIGDLTFTLD